MTTNWGGTFVEQGYALLPGFLDVKQTEQLTELLNRHLDEGSPSRIVANDDVSICRSILSRDEQVARIVSGLGAPFDVLKDASRLLRDEVTLKHSDSSREYPWHQDEVVTQDPSLLTVTLWLTPAGPDEGTLELIPGSHRRGAQSHVEQTGKIMLAADDQLFSQAIQPRVEAGTASIFHRHIIHRGMPNRSGRSVMSYVFMMKH